MISDHACVCHLGLGSTCPAGFNNSHTVAQRTWHHGARGEIRVVHRVHGINQALAHHLQAPDGGMKICRTEYTKCKEITHS